MKSLLTIGFLGSLALLSGCQKDAPQVVQVSSVNVESLTLVEVHKQAVPLDIPFDGVVEAVNRAVVSAQTSGRVIELPFDVGDFVAKGDLIARFTDTEQVAGLTAAKAQLEEAKAGLTDAEQQLTRIKGVFERGVVAKADYDRAKAGHSAAAARVEAAKAALRDAEQRFSYTQVIAPYSGIVVARLTDVGATIGPGAPLLEGVSLEHLRVQVDVPQNYIGYVRRYKQARVVFSSNDQVISNDLRIPPSADPASHSFKVLVDLPQGERSNPVFPGTLVKVAFTSGNEAQLTVPGAAIAKRGEVNAVYVINGGNLEFRYIRTGKVLDDGAVVVVAGLSENEKIAIDPVAAADLYKQQVTQL